MKGETRIQVRTADGLVTLRFETNYRNDGESIDQMARHLWPTDPTARRMFADAITRIDDTQLLVNAIVYEL